MKITSNVEWDVVEIGEGVAVTPTKGKGNGTISVTMAANATINDIIKSFKVKAKVGTITRNVDVTQLAGDETLSLDVTSLEFAKEGAIKDVKITSNVEWDVVEVGVGVTVTPTKGKGNGTISVTMVANATLNTITKSFKVKAKTGTITHNVAVIQYGTAVLIHNETEGGLEAILNATPSFKAEPALRITGTMSEADFEALKKTSATTLEYLDISKLSNTKIPGSIFRSAIISEIILPEKVTYLGSYMFENCVNLKEIIIPAGVARLIQSTLYGCSALTKVTFLGETKIEDRVFQKCISIENITLPKTMTKIFYDVFNGCTSLKSIDIPARVKEIGHGAFLSCKNMTSVTCRAITPPTLGENAFLNIPAEATLKVPAASVASYKADINWTTYFKVANISAIQ